MALTNSQYDAIMRTYEQRRLRNHDIQTRRYEEIYRRIPQIQDIDRLISEYSLQQARKLLEGDATALEASRREIRDLSAKKAQLLSASGYPADYLEPVYTCADCQDTGYAGNQKCHCFQKAIIDLLYTQSNLKEVLQRENFDTFSLDFYSANYIDKITGQTSLEMAKHALRICRHFTDTFADEFQNLLFYGDTGIGKSFLSNCIAKELMDRAYSVIYFTASELFGVFAKSAFDRDADAGNTESLIHTCDLLIIDDLGTELGNSFTVSQLFICLNERILRKKSTIISTNLSLNDVKSIYSERIFSRISSNFTFIKLAGDDIRLKKKLMNREAD